MIKYQGKQYPSYVEIFLAMCNEDILMNIKIFPSPKYFYIRNHLKEKFNREYSINDIKTLMRNYVST